MNPTSNILLVEDEEHLIKVLTPTLEAAGYGVNSAMTGEDGLSLAQASPPSLVVLDLGLPDLDGKDVIRGLRRWSRVPIIVLSARDQESEKIEALDAGADDYLVKPFSMGEFLARVRVALRGEPGDAAHIYSAPGVTFDFRRRVAKLPYAEVSLSGRESQFLRILTERPGLACSYSDIILAVWGDITRADAQFVRVLAGQVRAKIEKNPSKPELVLTAPGVGYIFAVPGAKTDAET